MKYLYEENDVIFVECEDCGRILKFKKYQIQDIKTGVECFCGSISSSVRNMPKPDNGVNTVQQAQVQDMKVLQDSVPIVNNRTPVAHSTPTTAEFTPKCPTCGSTRIHKISLASKAIGGYMWGIFSSNVRNTFECNNCGYKW